MEKKNTRKSQILEAALTLFSDFGYHGVAVPKIAEAAQVATGSLYKYFPSKDALVNELFIHWKLELKTYVLRNFAPQASPQEQFYVIWRALFSYADDHPKAFQFIENHLHAPYLSAESLAVEEELFEIGRAFVRLGQAAGVIRDDAPQLLVAFFFGAFVQFFKDCNANRLSWSLADSERLRDYCWSAMIR